MSDRREGLLRYVRFWGPNVDADVDDELRYHVEMRTRDFIAQGLSPEGAREEALRLFGDPAAVARELRAHDAAKLRTARRADMLQDVGQDLRYGARKLVQAPGFTAAVVLVLALGIGANTAVFSAVDAALFRPLPFFQPERLVALQGMDVPFFVGPKDRVFPKYSPNFEDVRAQRDLFSQVAAYATGGLNLTGGAEPIRATVTYTTADFFSLLGVMPVVGRPFSAGETTRGGANAVVISYALWQRQFGGDPHVTDRRVELNAISYAIVGVMPSDFSFPKQTDVWIAWPLPAERAMFAAFRNYIPTVFAARLAPGVARAAAIERMETFRRRVNPKVHDGEMPAADLVKPLQDELVGDRRTPLLILMGSAALLLLIACANVTNLLLARATTRQREIALRIALGATRLRVIRQLAVESALLAVVGGALALGVAWVSLGLLTTALPASLATVSPPRIDARVLAFTVLVALTTSLVFGVWPAIGSSKVDLNDAMKSRGAGLTHRGARGVRGTLVVAELSLALMLLVGAGLLIDSLHRLLTVDSGIRTENLVTARLTLPPAKFQTPLARSAFVAAVVARMQTIPGVASAAAVNALPMESVGGIALRATPEEAPDDVSRGVPAMYLSATPGYFRTLGTRMRGEDLPGSADSLNPVAVINETMARKLWPGQDAMGKRVVSPAGRRVHTVIGVVADIRTSRLDEMATAQMYFPMAESPQFYVSVLARGTADTRSLITAIRESVRAIDPSQPIYAAQPMSDVVRTSVAPRRTNTILFATFGGLALLLAGIGVYALLAYGVAQRTREIGVRMALGAQHRDVVRLIMAQGAALSTAGIVIGMASAFALTRFLSSMLYDVGAHDRRVFVTVPVVLAVISLLATWLPARRATRVTPMDALREG
ncbi:MAG: permease [Gemmatimonadetes bacterium]|nr:permease [Gemmatimonadota bacterium]